MLAVLCGAGWYWLMMTVAMWYRMVFVYDDSDAWCRMVLANDDRCHVVQNGICL